MGMVKTIFSDAKFVLFFSLLCLLVSPVKANDIDGANVTIYSQNHALVKQECTINLKKGANILAWPDVPGSIDLNSVCLRSVGLDNPIEVKEQIYKNDLLNLNSLLSNSVGKTVYLRQFLPNGNSEEKMATIISAAPSDNNLAPNIVLKIDERYVIDPKGQIEINELPSNLVSKPELSFKLETAKSGEQKLNLTYDTSNINWQCDYLVALDRSQSKFDLVGLATVDNRCGVSYKNTNLKLLAGNVNQVAPVPVLYRAKSAGMMAMASNPTLPQENAFADYHLYTFDYPVDINNNETKRLNLVNGKSITAIKKYIFEQGNYGYIPPKQRLAVQVKFEFQNSKTNNLGKPLPAGPVKVYQEDSEHNLQFIGEDQIPHTAIDEKVTIKLGDAFDITAEKTKTDSQQIAEHQRQDKYKIVFHNQLDHEITVADIEHVGDNVTTLNSDSQFTKTDSNTYQFDVKIPAQSSAELTYNVTSKI